jgi:peptidoglycan/LPS O-acetylase OafA/YrhL
LSWFALLFIVFAVVFGSYFGLKQKAERIDEEKNLTKMQEVLACFSIFENFNSLFYRKFQDSTSIFDGIRALSLLWIISAHVELARFLDVIVDLNDISEFFKTFLASFIPQATYSVDAFFWLSGFLLGFLILDEANKRGGKIRWGGVFVTRIMRLLPMYIFILVFINFIIPSWTTGPKWDQVETYINTDCDKYWWTNLLFVNNHIPWYTGNDCVGQSWYMAADLQMLILSMPIISLYVYSHKSGWIVINSLIFISILYRLIVSYHYHVYITILNKFSDTNNFRKIHTSTISNLSPYLIGIICGFVLNHARKTKSSDTIILKIDSFFANKTKSLISFAVGFVIFIALVCIPYKAWSDIEGGYMGYPAWFQVMFIGFQNFNASVAFCLMFLPLLYEMVPLVSELLASKIWIPLAKASFSIYIIHIAVIRVFIAAERNASEFTEYRIVTDYLLFAPVSVVAGMALYVIIENPVARALKVLMTTRRVVGVKSLITELKSIP